MADPLIARRKRLMFQSLRRGTREGDFIIGGFAKRHLDGLDAGQLEKFENLLACNEPDLMAWGRSGPGLLRGRWFRAHLGRRIKQAHQGASNVRRNHLRDCEGRRDAAHR